MKVEDLFVVGGAENFAIEREYTKNSLQKAWGDEDNFYVPSQRERRAKREKISRKAKKQEAIKSARINAGYGKKSKDR